MSIPPPVLEYAGHDRDPSQELLIDERPDGGVTITVPTRRRTFAHALDLVTFDATGLIVLPITLPITWAVLKLFASRRPRAVLRLTAEEFIVTETPDTGLGWSTTAHAWPRASVAELRKNRFGNGLWLRVPGDV